MRSNCKISLWEVNKYPVLHFIGIQMFITNYTVVMRGGRFYDLAWNNVMTTVEWFKWRDFSLSWSMANIREVNHTPYFKYTPDMVYWENGIEIWSGQETVLLSPYHYNLPTLALCQGGYASISCHRDQFILVPSIISSGYFARFSNTLPALGRALFYP